MSKIELDILDVDKGMHEISSVLAHIHQATNDRAHNINPQRFGQLSKSWELGYIFQFKTRC